jgi:hypothetical protein
MHRSDNATQLIEFLQTLIKDAGKKKSLALIGFQGDIQTLLNP